LVDEVVDDAGIRVVIGQVVFVTFCVTVDAQAVVTCVTMDVEAARVCVTMDVDAGRVCVTMDVEVEAGNVCVTVEAGRVCVTVDVEVEHVDAELAILELGVGEAVPQRPALLIRSVSNVTAALSAMKEPLLEDPVVTVMAVRATTFPVNFVPVPMVAELPICQKILQGCAPLITRTTAAEAVVRVEPIWKTKWAFALPLAFSVRIPLSWAEDEKWYLPGLRTIPPRSFPVRS